MKIFKYIKAKIGALKLFKRNSKASEDSESAAFPPQPSSLPQGSIVESSALTLLPFLSIEELLTKLSLAESITKSLTEPLTEPMVEWFEEPFTAKSSALESSVFRNVPKEILLDIIQFLPVESAASLSLCCHPIYNLLGNQYVKALRQRRNKKNRSLYRFLRLLERELPNHITCYTCNRFHAIKQATGECDYDRHHIQISRWGFEFNNFQRNMKLYRQGRNHSTLNILFNDSYTQFMARHNFVEQHSLVVRIVDTTSSIIFREQTIYLMPMDQPLSTPTTMALCYDICGHFELSAVYNYRKRCLRYYDDEGLIHPIIWGTFKSCKYCMTEFRVDTVDLGTDGQAFFLTRWKDLGQAQSPLDTNWVKATAWGKARRAKNHLMEYDEGSICTAFEGVHYSKFEFDAHLTESDWDNLLKFPGYRKTRPSVKNPSQKSQKTLS